jgi:hypothetical protein
MDFLESNATLSMQVDDSEFSRAGVSTRKKRLLRDNSKGNK